MKAERLGQLLNAAVWDEQLIARIPVEVFHLVLRYILGADIDSEAFENKIRQINDPQTRATAMTLAQRYQPVFAVVAGAAGAISALLALLRFRADRKKK